MKTKWPVSKILRFHIVIVAVLEVEEMKVVF